MGIRLSSTICELLTLPPSWLPGMDSLSLTLRPVPTRQREETRGHGLVSHAAFLPLRDQTSPPLGRSTDSQIQWNAVQMKDLYTGGFSGPFCSCNGPFVSRRLTIILSNGNTKTTKSQMGSKVYNIQTTFQHSDIK